MGIFRIMSLRWRSVQWYFQRYASYMPYPHNLTLLTYQQSPPQTHKVILLHIHNAINKQHKALQTSTNPKTTVPANRQEGKMKKKGEKRKRRNCRTHTVSLNSESKDLEKTNVKEKLAISIQETGKENENGMQAIAPCSIQRTRSLCAIAHPSSRE